MTQLHLFELNSLLICNLQKALYCLKQAFQVPYQTIADFLMKLDFELLELYHSVFVFKQRQLILAFYVDDLVLFAFGRTRLQNIQV